ncbi:flagellar basal body rod protein FlgC [Natranaerofaba carboxydovora]|uniref:flagellar basal body rod protein FlgC n=1 Tax=Natranaerofaba carboxydovora TaxID=2742683 RepID=UPI001F146CAC|nr:flagellar basal body rod protein FlgC [Natranaerofaba carboxydovora]UMZ73354.1 Flagellar basal-body rod protein FlgC [Natranaerofaba carboxydovora]
MPFNSFDISASGLTSERLRMDTISNNIANANTTRTEDGEPYRRKMVAVQPRKATFAEHLNHFIKGRRGEDLKLPGGGVKATSIVEDDSAFKEVYDPEHPDADPDTGYVQKPNVNTVNEMTDLITASRAYEANVTAMDSSKEMANNILDLGLR